MSVGILPFPINNSNIEKQIRAKTGGFNVEKEFPVSSLAAFITTAVDEAKNACNVSSVRLKKMTVSAKTLGVWREDGDPYVHVANVGDFGSARPTAAELATTVTMEIETL
jgi:hypothetical protein